MCGEGRPCISAFAYEIAHSTGTLFGTCFLPYSHRRDRDKRGEREWERRRGRRDATSRVNEISLDDDFDLRESGLANIINTEPCIHSTIDLDGFSLENISRCTPRYSTTPRISTVNVGILRARVT